MTNQDCINALTKLKSELIGNLAIYHERITLLIEIIQFEILEDRVNFKAKIIKPLDKEYAASNKLFKIILGKEYLTFGSSYQFDPNSTSNLINGNVLSRPYCPYILWLDPKLTEFVRTNNDEMTKKIPRFILQNEDWTVLTQMKH